MSLRPTRSAALLAAGLLLALTGCGGDDESSASSDGGDTAAQVSEDLDDVRSGDVPEECVTAFPLAIEPADLADVTLRPEGFPEPPVDGTLCETSSTLDDTITTAGYATEATATEVLDAYELQLGSIYDVARADDGAGETLTADLGTGVFVQVTPGDGSYSIAFGQA
jgi:hypothetical protein